MINDAQVIQPWEVAPFDPDDVSPRLPQAVLDEVRDNFREGEIHRLGQATASGGGGNRGRGTHTNIPSGVGGSGYAALFAGWWTDEDGNRWMKIAEQWAPRYTSSGRTIREGKPAMVRKLPASEAGRYRIITRR
jgi:hypothetical protein